MKMDNLTTSSQSRIQSATHWGGRFHLPDKVRFGSEAALTGPGNHVCYRVEFRLRDIRFCPPDGDQRNRH